MRQFFSFLARVEEVFLCLLLFGMIVLAFLQIILRDIFSGGFAWADPLLRYMVLWAGFLGAAIATKRDKHIAIDVASHLLPVSVSIWLRVVIHFFSGLVCLVLTYASFAFVRDEMVHGGGQVVLGISSWVLSSIFPLAFGLIAVRFFIRFWHSLTFLYGRKSTQAKGEV